MLREELLHVAQLVVFKAHTLLVKNGDTDGELIYRVSVVGDCGTISSES